MHKLSLILLISLLNGLKADDSCKIGDNEYDGYCYTFVDQRLLYQDAQAHCVAEGGSLVRFRGNADSHWLTTIAATKFHATYGNFWIGLHLEDNKWVWEDGHPVDYLNWSPGYPLNAYDFAGAQISNSKWVTVGSSSTLPFICFYQKGAKKEIATTEAPATDSPRDVCDGADLLLDRRCYFFLPTHLQYDEAKQECEKVGKTLAIFDNQMQTHFVTATAATKFSMTYGSFWIGLAKNSNDNQFYWADGNLNTLNFWTPGYPFQHQTVVSQQISDSRWRTSDKSNSLPVVCSGFI